MPLATNIKLILLDCASVFIFCRHPTYDKKCIFLVPQSHPPRVQTSAARAASRSSKTTSARRKKAIRRRRRRRSSRKSAGDPSCPPGTCRPTKTPTQCQTGERKRITTSKQSILARLRVRHRPGPEVKRKKGSRCKDLELTIL